MSRPRRGEPRRILNLNLRFMVLPLLWGILLISPYPRGLFFAADLYPFHVACACLLALLLLDDLIARSAPAWSPDAIAAFIIAVAYAISFTVAVDKHMALQDLLKYMGYFVLFYVSRRLIRSPGSLRNLMRVFMLSAFGVMTIGLLGALGLGTFPGVFYQGSVLSTFQYRNALGGYLLSVAAAGLTLTATTEGSLEPLLLSVLNYLMALTTITTYSRGTWVLFPCVIIGLIICLPREARWKILYSAMVSVSCAFLVLRRFWESVGSKQPDAGLRWLVIGAIAALALEVVWLLGRAYVRAHGDIEPRFKRVTVALAIIYTVVLTGVYAAYAVDAYPNLVARVLPKQVIARAEDIKADESSLLGRVEFMRDALRISLKSPIIGRGGGAFNALYHMYQDALYWSSEVHSHYLQMLVESGLLGVGALAAMWYFVIRRLKMAYDPENDSLDWALVMGAMGSVIAVSVHAAIDFNLSIPAIAYLVWIMLGSVSGSVSYWLADTDLASARGPSQKGDRFGSIISRIWPVVLLGVIAIMAVVPYRLYRAGHEGAQGARWLMQNNYARAERSYAEAIRLNPYDGAFYIDMAQTKIGSYYILRDDRLLAAADEYIDKALKVQPYSLRIRFQVVDLYTVQGKFDQAVRAAEEVVRILPLDPKSYELIGKTALLAAMDRLNVGKTEDARVYTGKVHAIRPRIKELADKIPAGAIGQVPRATAPILLYSGQAFALDDRLDEAVSVLGEARRHAVVQDEASIWLGLVHLKAGRVRDGTNLIRGVLQKNAAYEGILRELAQIMGVTLPEVPR